MKPYAYTFLILCALSFIGSVGYVAAWGGAGDLARPDAPNGSVVVWGEGEGVLTESDTQRLCDLEVIVCPEEEAKTSESVMRPAADEKTVATHKGRAVPKKTVIVTAYTSRVEETDTDPEVGAANVAGR